MNANRASLRGASKHGRAVGAPAMAFPSQVTCGDDLLLEALPHIRFCALGSSRVRTGGSKRSHSAAQRVDGGHGRRRVGRDGPQAAAEAGGGQEAAAATAAGEEDGGGRA
ncbi:hypothetical protein ON010_g13157 [Phytophthora cinnamomi]|nr:hypothetical protein ON010_g13157 [Phytophthora cinnamomi]